MGSRFSELMLGSLTENLWSSCWRNLDILPLVQYLGAWSWVRLNCLMAERWSGNDRIKRSWCFRRNRKVKSKPWVTDFKLVLLEGVWPGGVRRPVVTVAPYWHPWVSSLWSSTAVLRWLQDQRTLITPPSLSCQPPSSRHSGAEAFLLLLLRLQMSPCGPLCSLPQWRRPVVGNRIKPAKF